MSQRTMARSGLTPAQYRELWLTRLLRYLPVTWVSAIGGHLGARYGHELIGEGHPWVGNLCRNFELFLGIKDPDEQRRRVIAYTRRFGRIYAEYTALQRLVARGRVEIVGREHLAGVSRPSIVVGCHLSNWELAGYVLLMLEGDACALYLRQDNPVRELVAARARQSWHDSSRSLELVPASPRAPWQPGAMRQLVRALNSGRNMLIYIDEPRADYVWAPSLGRKLPEAGNRWLTARLAVRHQLDILPVHVETVGVARYRIVIAPRLSPGKGDEAASVRALADEMDRWLETWIRPDLENWYSLKDFVRDKPAPR
jgi:lauroyl/myristoyl acyltransferase